MIDLFTRTPHRRWNPLKSEWVVVSPHRTQRPWQGQMEIAGVDVPPRYDATCYLCPGNQRAGGQQTPQYAGTYIFENDFAALKDEGESQTLDVEGAGLLRAATERGICRVLCFDPRHDLTLATMPVAAIERVVQAWTGQEAELGALPEIAYVQIFENRGQMMGASNPHPHGQIWATETLPNEPARELTAQREYLQQHGSAMLADYLRLELKQAERVVCENESWVAVVPFWAVWPFETLLLPRVAAARLGDLDEGARAGLAAMLKTITAGYNAIFATVFPYSMGLHPAPCDGFEHPEWTLHAHFYPPLLRSATIRKFMVGFELLGSPQRDITPEAAASVLQAAILHS